MTQKIYVKTHVKIKDLYGLNYNNSCECNQNTHKMAGNYTCIEKTLDDFLI